MRMCDWSSDVCSSDLITENLGGPVDKIVRQRRWRPVWRATYQDNGAPTDLLCKGTREWSAHPYPLEYEMRMMQVLEANGIRVPHVHGMCHEPLAIIMEWMRGGRDPGLGQEAIESGRSEEGSGGTEGGRTCRARGGTYK